MKKIFTSLFIAAMAVSASAVNLWNGTCTFANWGVESGDRPVFAASVFADAKVGDKLVCTVTNNVSDPIAWHQVELWSWNAEEQKPDESLCQGVQVLAATTEVSFTLDAILLGKLQEKGCALAGTGYVLSSVDLTTFSGVIWEGECRCPNWTAAPPVNLPGTMFAAAKEGDKLVFSVTKINDADWAGIQIDKSTYVPSSFGMVTIVEHEEQVTFTLTAALLEELQASGINITGANFILTKIEVVSGDPADLDAIWSGSMTTTDWSNYLEIMPESFAAVKEGDVIEFTVTGAAADGCISLKQRLASGWEEMPCDTEWANYLYLTEGDCTATFAVNAAAAETLKANGLVVAGSNYTLTKVAYADPNAISAVSADAQRAVAGGVYNLQGIRVADSMAGVTVPGLYICNGKKFIVR